MNPARLIGLVLIGCVVLWAIASYRAERAVAPPLDPYGRAEWYYFASEYDEAAKAYREALAQGLDETKTRDALFKIARSLHQGGRYRDAVGAYENFIRQYPTSDEANRAQGHVEWIRQNRGISSD